ncbi:MAG TPA: glucose-6-phosphate dehydrogenase assembly protein OpcA [Segeticoccus sp.]|uniref:glucose-6-phosphate dehydrogenase assembly protein OpcA n=1 Tax=Segeticoccus sp. TaxID=2706531 RepID=UPI002D7FD3DA|nr:glucose-6-phosphate dehydrogenase assembly protein OpcA [Segeticoccus sp.]HET8600244.1 glucose-6-phosphate dehydrogenase assembly protein OpcA [Segeticoccus sp.]
MIVDLPSTSTTAVSKRLVKLRNESGAMTLGRVLTLIIVCDDETVDDAIEAANAASHQHPCRIVVLVRANRRGSNRLDAQIRVGGDAGASEVVVMRLYGQLADHGQRVALPLLLADSPVVVWWPHDAPRDVAGSPIGQLADRRITDAAEARNPQRELQRRAQTYAPGDTDLAWTRITIWRGLLAAALDQGPYEPVLEATVSGASDSPSTDLLAGWLADTLDCPVRRAKGPAGTGMTSVRLERKSGPVDLVRPDGTVATLSQPGQPIRRISLARRSTAQCLADELRRLDPDEIYSEALIGGMAEVRGRRAVPMDKAIADGEAPSLEESREERVTVARRARALGSDKMVEEPPQSARDADTVHEAASRKLESKAAGEAGSGQVTAHTNADGAGDGDASDSDAASPGDGESAAGSGTR